MILSGNIRYADIEEVILIKNNVQEKSVRVWNKNRNDQHNKDIWHISMNQKQNLLMSEWQIKTEFFQKQT